MLLLLLSRLPCTLERGNWPSTGVASHGLLAGIAAAFSAAIFACQPEELERGRGPGGPRSRSCSVAPPDSVSFPSERASLEHFTAATALPPGDGPTLQPLYSLLDALMLLADDSVVDCLRGMPSAREAERVCRRNQVMQRPPKEPLEVYHDLAEALGTVVDCLVLHQGKPPRLGSCGAPGRVPEGEGKSRREPVMPDVRPPVSCGCCLGTTKGRCCTDGGHQAPGHPSSALKPPPLYGEAQYGRRSSLGDGGLRESREELTRSCCGERRQAKMREAAKADAGTVLLEGAMHELLLLLLEHLRGLADDHGKTEMTGRRSIATAAQRGRNASAPDGDTCRMTRLSSSFSEGGSQSDLKTGFLEPFRSRVFPFFDSTVGLRRASGAYHAGVPAVQETGRGNEELGGEELVGEQCSDQGRIHGTAEEQTEGAPGEEEERLFHLSVAGGKDLLLLQQEEQLERLRSVVQFLLRQQEMQLVEGRQVDAQALQEQWQEEQRRWEQERHARASSLRSPLLWHSGKSWADTRRAARAGSAEETEDRLPGRPGFSESTSQAERVIGAAPGMRKASLKTGLQLTSPEENGKPSTMDERGQDTKKDVFSTEVIREPCIHSVNSESIFLQECCSSPGCASRRSIGGVGEKQSAHPIFFSISTPRSTSRSPRSCRRCVDDAPSQDQKDRENWQ